MCGGGGGGAGSSSPRAYSFSPASATNCLLHSLCAMFPFSFHPGVGGRRVGTQFRSKLPKTGTYLSAQHRRSSLVGVGHTPVAPICPCSPLA